MSDLPASEAEAAGLRGAALPVMVMDHLPEERRRSTRVLRRGSYLEPMEDVSAGTPAFRNADTASFTVTPAPAASGKAAVA